MSASPVVSVLTPVYNGAPFLEECIESVLRQTFTDWEYVIVDNVSTDGTAAIADRFAAQDSRIRVVRATEFVDIYGNHNRALRMLDPGSRYCKIVHADDFLYPECIERMVEVAESNPSVGIVTAYRLMDKEVQLDGLFPYSQSVMPGREVLRQAFHGTILDWVVGSPTSLLLRSDLFRKDGDFYDRSVWHADVEAAFRVLLDADLGFVHQVLTYTRDHPGALSSYTYRVYTFPPLEGRLLIHLGPKVLSRAEYQADMRRWLWRYGSWLAKQKLRPSRHGQSEFHAFHRREIKQMIADAPHDRWLRAMLGGLLLLLENGRPAVSAPR